MLVEVGQVVLPLLIVRDKCLLRLDQSQALLLKLFALGVLVLDSCDRESILVELGVLGKEFKKLVEGNERKLFIWMAEAELAG